MKNVQVFALLLCCAVSSLASYPSELSYTSPTKPPENLPPTRLSKALYPDRYWISLKPYFPSSVTYEKEKEWTFDGEVTIEFRVITPTKNVTVNVRNITVVEGSVAVTGVGVESVKQVLFRQHLVIALDRELQPGAVHNVTLKYTGVINDYKTAGLFYTEFITEKEEKHYLIASHFEEGALCRSTVPSFDEPMFKSIYFVTLIHPSDLIALSNGMEIGTQALGNGWSSTNFKPIKPMSSYLLAVAIGDFVKVQTTNQHGTLIRVWAWRGMEPYLDVALDSAARVLDWFGDFFQVQFPLEKEDLLGLPEMRPGAMENWGLVIFKHSQMAFNPHMETSVHKGSSVIATVVHELAHQWFGDLVTMEWWSDIFLNEGFAQYWEFVGAAGIFPDQANLFDVTEPTGYLESGLSFDGVRRISHPVIDPLGPYFDKITYSKGGSLLRMINHTLTAPNFQLALQRYLNKHKYGNTMHADLWSAFSEVAEEKGITDWCGNSLNFSALMDPWTMQQGFPTIVVRQDASGAKTITQRPFQNFTELNLPDSKFNYQWPIPDWYRDVSDLGKYRLTWLMPNDWSYEKSCVGSVVTRRDQAIVSENAASRAFARVLYDNATWAPMVKYIQKNPGAYDPITRTQLLNDALVFMGTPEIPGYSRFLELGLYLANETSLAPWKYAAKKEFEQFIDDFMQGAEWPLLLQYFRATVQPVYEELGWKRDADWDRNGLREIITRMACRLHLGDCMSQAQTIFRTQLLAPCAEPKPHCSKVDPDVRDAVYCAGVELGTQTEYEKVWKNFVAEKKRNHHQVAERDNLMKALACTRNTENVNSLLEYAVKDSDLLGGEMLAAMAQNPVATKIMWQYLQDNLNKVIESPVRHNFLHSMTQSWNDQGDVDRMNDLRQRSMSQLSEIGNSALKNATQNVLKHKSNFDSLGHTITDWLRANLALPKPSAVTTRLPNSDLLPMNYNMSIQPYFAGSNTAKYDANREMTFDGEISVTIQALKPTNEIYMNADKLDISDCVVTDVQSGKVVPLTVHGVRTYPDVQQIVIMLQEALHKAHVYSIKMKYTGLINDFQDDGLFHSTYTNKDGKIKHIVATQFEHIRARAMFPSFDEPAYKTPYDIMMVHPSDMTAIGNMPANKTTSIGFNLGKKKGQYYSNGWSKTVFETSPPVSSYLVALAVGDIIHKETQTDKGVKIRVWERPGHEKELDICLKSAQKAVQYFDKYLNQKFPLPKLDIIGLPQYKGGGMENFGLITQKSSVTTFVPNASATKNLSQIVKVTIHEVAHQWFGDLVTMKWWDEIFLNEGFANFWEFSAPTEVYPEQAKYFTSRYVPEILKVALEGDSSNNSHSLHYTYARDPDFGSSITYAKGGALLRMLQYVLGEKAFQQGLQIYMDKFKYSNTEHEDLFNAFTQAAASNNVRDWCNRPLNVSLFMDPWLLQQSFPVISIDTQPSGSTLTQSVYNDKNTLPPSTFGYEWPIPVWYKTPTEKEQLRWIVPKYLSGECAAAIKGSLELPGNSALNLQARMYAIVDYDQTSWGKLMRQFFNDPQALDVNVRSQVLNDVRMLAKRDPSKTRQLLQVVSYLSAENQLAPWDTIKTWLDETQNSIQGSRNQYMFKRYLLNLHVPVYQSLGWETGKQDWDEKILRSLILARTCDLDYTPCVRRANSEFYNFIKSCSSAKNGLAACTKLPEPDIQDAVYCTGVRTADTANAFNSLFELFKQEATEQPLNDNAIRLLGGLTCTTKPLQLIRLMNWGMSKNVPELMSAIESRPSANDALWQYTQQTPQELMNSPQLPQYLQTMTNQWTHTQHQQKFDWLRQKPEFDSQRGLLKDLQSKYEQRRQNWMKTMDTVENYSKSAQFDTMF